MRFWLPLFACKDTATRHRISWTPRKGHRNPSQSLFQGQKKCLHAAALNGFVVVRLRHSLGRQPVGLVDLKQLRYETYRPGYTDAQCGLDERVERVGPRVGAISGHGDAANKHSRPTFAAVSSWPGNHPGSTHRPCGAKSCRGCIVRSYGRCSVTPDPGPSDIRSRRG